MPRTTIDLEGPVLDRLKQLARREGKSLGRIASELLAQALSSKDERPLPFEWSSQAMRPRVDLEDKEALQAVLDER